MGFNFEQVVAFSRATVCQCRRNGAISFTTTRPCSSNTAHWYDNARVPYRSRHTHTLSPCCSLCQALTTVASTLATFFLARRGGAQSVWRAAPRRVRMALAAMALGVVAQVCVIVL